MCTPLILNTDCLCNCVFKLNLSNFMHYTLTFSLVSWSRSLENVFLFYLLMVSIMNSYLYLCLCWDDKRIYTNTILISIIKIELQSKQGVTVDTTDLRQVWKWILRYTECSSLAIFAFIYLNYHVVNTFLGVGRISQWPGYELDILVYTK